MSEENQLFAGISLVFSFAIGAFGFRLYEEWIWLCGALIGSALGLFGALIEDMDSVFGTMLMGMIIGGVLFRFANKLATILVGSIFGSIVGWSILFKVFEFPSHSYEGKPQFLNITFIFISGAIGSIFAFKFKKFTIIISTSFFGALIATNILILMGGNPGKLPISAGTFLVLWSLISTFTYMLMQYNNFPNFQKKQTK